MVAWKRDSRSDRTLRALRFRRRSLLLMLCLRGLAPVRRNVLVPWCGRRVSGAEGGHRRSEQPYHDAPTQRALGGRIRASTKNSNAGSIYAEVRRVNGLALPLWIRQTARFECSTTKALFLLLLGTIANHFDLRTFKFGSQLAIAPRPAIEEPHYLDTHYRIAQSIK